MLSIKSYPRFFLTAWNRSSHILSLPHRVHLSLANSSQIMYYLPMRPSMLWIFRKKEKKVALALKLDISKAYNRVEWPFLHSMMVKLGFPEKWIKWVMECVRSPSYSIMINGKLYGHLQPSRGICQGDPLSPYLFLLCVEGFTTLLEKANMERRISGVSICRSAPKITNLLLADDSLLFCQAS